MLGEVCAPWWSIGGSIHPIGASGCAGIRTRDMMPHLSAYLLLFFVPVLIPRSSFAQVRSAGEGSGSSSGRQCPQHHRRARMGLPHGQVLANTQSRRHTVGDDCGLGVSFEICGSASVRDVLIYFICISFVQLLK